MPYGKPWKEFDEVRGTILHLRGERCRIEGSVWQYGFWTAEFQSPQSGAGC